MSGKVGPTTGERRRPKCAFNAWRDGALKSFFSVFHPLQFVFRGDSGVLISGLSSVNGVGACAVPLETKISKLQ